MVTLLTPEVENFTEVREVFTHKRYEMYIQMITLLEFIKFGLGIWTLLVKKGILWDVLLPIYWDQFGIVVIFTSSLKSYLTYKIYMCKWFLL